MTDLSILQDLFKLVVREMSHFSITEKYFEIIRTGMDSTYRDTELQPEELNKLILRSC